MDEVTLDDLIAELTRIRDLHPNTAKFPVRIASTPHLSWQFESVMVVAEDDGYGPHIRLVPSDSTYFPKAEPNPLIDFTVFGFNTGRAYTGEGQRISVAYKLDMTEESEVLVLFYDHSRGIFGRLKTEKLNGAKKLFLEKNNYQRAKYVMGLYDNGHHQYHPQADKVDAQDFPLIAL
jgi:hypothetical protein